MPKHRFLPPIRATQRLALIFVITILSPGLILGLFAVRALIQDRQLVDQQIRERLDGIAESAARRVELAIRDWQQTANELARTNLTNRESWPQVLRAATAEPGMAVVLLKQDERVEAFPPGELLYELSPPPASTTNLKTIAEELELREKRYDQAVILYRGLLESAKPVERALILHRIARTLKKAGRLQEAMEMFRLLEKEPPIRIGSLPSDLLALYEVTSLESEPERSQHALRLYRGLVEGRWRLEKASYLFYSEKVRGWIPQSEEVRLLAGLEQRKLSLSRAAESYLEMPRFFSADDTVFLAFARMEPFAVVLLGEPFLRNRLLTSDNADFEFSLFSTENRKQPFAAHPIQIADISLQVHVWPKDPERLYAGMNRRQNLYAGMFAVVVVLLVFGSYLTLRILKTELAVAQIKSDFVSTVSHEFRSPLTGIHQLAEMLRDGRVTDEARRQDYYEMIVTETQRLRRMVENILDFSRMQDGRKEYRFEEFDAARWLKEVAEDFQNRVAGRGFAIETRIPPELPAIVADRDTLTTAVHNLLDNAVKYSRDIKTVQLHAHANRDGVSISVSDRGVGIQEEDRPHIFEKFYRGRGEHAREVKGVGLGLNLVQHIVKAHGGRIDFDSKAGEGSTFTIHLKTEKQTL